MDVSIVIRTKNEGQYIEETLKLVLKQETSCDYEILVVDSGSTDSTLEIINAYPVRLIEIAPGEFSYGRSLNLGASKAKGKYVVNLSAHAFPGDEMWLGNLISGFDDNNVAGIYGRQLSEGNINPFEALQNKLFFGQRQIKFKLGDRGKMKDGHFSNSNCAVRKDVWQKFQFDEHVAYAEDILWQAKVIEAGFSILYAPAAAVYHTHRISINKAYKNARSCAYSLALMKRKRQSILLAIADIGMLLSAVPYSIFQNLRYILLNNYLEHLKITPVYLMSGWLGWLRGRLEYRLGRE